MLLSVSDSVLLLPTCTLPKLRLVGLAPIVPAVTAVPESVTLSDGLDASLVTVKVPDGVPAAVGANVTLIGVLAPAAIVNGTVTPVTL